MLLGLAFYIKVSFIVLELAVGIAFCVCVTRFNDQAAVLEWIIAFLFVLYALGFSVDLSPAVSREYGDQHTVEERRVL
jgi:ABC-type polysaccharide/polyol phosphate export permease